MKKVNWAYFLLHSRLHPSRWIQVIIRRTFPKVRFRGIVVSYMSTVYMI